MIVKNWPVLTRAIDKAIPCYMPFGDLQESRCGTCEPCRDYDRVQVALAAVEDDIQDALDEAARGYVL